MSRIWPRILTDLRSRPRSSRFTVSVLLIARFALWQPHRSQKQNFLSLCFTCSKRLRLRAPLSNLYHEICGRKRLQMREKSFQRYYFYFFAHRCIFSCRRARMNCIKVNIQTHSQTHIPGGCEKVHSVGHNEELAVVDQGY